MGYMGQSFGEVCTNAGMEPRVSTTGIFCLTLTSITDCAQCSRKSQNADKRFLIPTVIIWSKYSPVYTKGRGFRVCFLFDKEENTDTLKPFVLLCIQRSTWIGKWTVRKVDWIKSQCAKLDCDIVVPNILADTYFCGWNIIKEKYVETRKD